MKASKSATKRRVDAERSGRGGTGYSVCGGSLSDGRGNANGDWRSIQRQQSAIDHGLHWTGLEYDET